MKIGLRISLHVISFNIHTYSHILILSIINYTNQLANVEPSWYVLRFNEFNVAASSTKINWPQVRNENETKQLSTEHYRTCSHFGFRVPVQLNCPVHFHIPRPRPFPVECNEFFDSSNSMDEHHSFQMSSTELSSASSDLYIPKLVIVRILFNRGWTNVFFFFNFFFLL